MFYYLVHMECVLFLFLLINCENYVELKKIKNDTKAANKCLRSRRSPCKDLELQK